MSIELKHGSIFDSKAEVLVCPVNCVGVMGKGLALEFKRRDPVMFRWYNEECKANRFKPGMCYMWQGTWLATTKLHWREKSKHCWVGNSLREIAMCVRSAHISSIAIPQLGCGCGGLDWDEVWPLYEKHLGGLDCVVEVWIHG